jgi:N-acetylglucosamine kinase-like BadF-type ATPase
VHPGRADLVASGTSGGLVTRVLAVDGGQSGIRICHSDTAQVVVVAGVSHLAPDSVSAVAVAVEQGWRQLGEAGIDVAVMGLSTAPEDPDARTGLCRLLGATTHAREVWLAGDAVTAHAGALSLGWGVSVTVGTGVACLALPRVGEPHVLGGHGFLLGDDGGGYWIGREAIRASLRAHDGMAPATALGTLVERRLGPLEGLPTRLHRTSHPVNEIAQLAPEVLAIADADDPVAAGIASATVRELVALIAAAARSIDPGDGRVPVALGGRLVEAGTSLRRRIEQSLGAHPRLAVRSADGSPLEGALRLGLAGDPGRYARLVHVWHPVAAA